MGNGGEARRGWVMSQRGNNDWSIMPPPLGTDRPDEAYAELIKWAHALLKPQGFRKSRTTFYRWNDACTQVIAFNKSTWRAGREYPLSFYVDVGVAVKGAIWEPQPDRPHPVKSLFSCDYSMRLDSWDERMEQGWVVKNLDEARTVWGRITGGLTETVLPIFDGLISDESLAELFNRTPNSVTGWLRDTMKKRGVEIAPYT